MCDAQAGYESILTALPAALTGANLIYGAGMVDSGMALDYGKLLMDDEINLSIKHVLKGIEVNDETLSVSLIKEVGRTGEFLTHHSTFHYFRNAMSPQLMNRENYEQWISNGGTSLHERALDKAKSMVENHQTPPISRQAQKEIEEIIRETERELKVIS